MGIISRLRAETRASSQTAHPRDPVVAEWWGGSNTAAGVSVAGDGALRIAAVYGCVNLLSRTMGTLPVHMYARRADGGRERDDADPIAVLLRDRPNRWQTPFEFKQMLMGHVCLRGNAYAEIDQPGNPREVVPMHPDRVMPFFAPNGEIAYRHRPENGADEILLADEVLHLRGLSSGLLKGLSPLELHRETFGENLAAQQYSARFFGNNAQPKGAIVVPSPMEEPDAQKLLNLWMKKHAGAENAGRPAIMHSGMDWKQIGMSNEDAQYIETRKFTRREIAMIFGIPPHKIGDLEQATFSNIEHQAIEFVTDAVEPWATAWAQRLNLSLMSAAKRRAMFLEFDLKGLLRGDAAARAGLYAALFGMGAISPFGVATAENLDPADTDGPSKDYFVPLNMAPANRVLDILLKDKGGSGEGKRLRTLMKLFAERTPFAGNANGGLHNGH